MDLFDSIFTRKSCRNYTQQPFAQAQLDEISGVIGSFDPLYPHVPLTHRFATKAKGPFNVKAPHYLFVSGQTGSEEEMTNAGFLFQQLVLWFNANNIGCVWLGKAADVEQTPHGKDLIAIAFGQATGPVHRNIAECTRKPIADITNAPEDPCIQAAHLAPSGMNLQPWYWEKTTDSLLLYRQIIKPPVSLAYKKTTLDMGIGLCHYALACKHFNRPFAFTPTKEGPARKGYSLFGELR